jgi:hypothetical protein
MDISRLWRSRRCSLEYRLPVSCVRFKGDVTYTTDQLGTDPQPKKSAKAAATLEVMAADEPQLSLDVQPVRLCDTKVSVAVTDDLRLTTAGFSSTGQGGPIVLGIASVLATVAGVAIDRSLPALSAPGGMTFLAEEIDLEALTKGAVDPVWQKYMDEQGEQATLLEACRKTVAGVEKAIAAEASGLGNGSDVDRLSRLRVLEKMLAIANAELDRLNRRFDTWRAGKISTRVEQHEYVLSLDELGNGCSVDGGAIKFLGDKSEQDQQETIWNTLGIAVHIDPTDPPHTKKVRQRRNQVIIRIPRRVQATVYERVDEDVNGKVVGKARLVESRPYLIMDQHCATQTIRLHSSLFGKKADDMTFSALGGMATYSTETTSAAAGLAETLGKLPETVGSGLEQSTKLLDQVSSLRGRALKEQIANLQAQIDLKKAEIEKAGLWATESGAAELARLKQELEFAEIQYKLANPGSS